MTTRDPRVDAYIAKAPDFARPMLERLRGVFLKADKGMVETIKWGAPWYECHGLVGGMVAFKAHVNIAFNRGRELRDPHGLIQGGSMGGIRVNDGEKLPSQTVLLAYVREAIALNAAKPKPKKAVRVPAMPEDFAAALAGKPKAARFFDSLAPSHRRDYLEWILGAKQAATRARRIATAVAWLGEGKSMNWKYEKKQ